MVRSYHGRTPGELFAARVPVVCLLPCDRSHHHAAAQPTEICCALNQYGCPFGIVTWY